MVRRFDSWKLFHLYSKRAGRRGRANHPVEFSDADDCLEMGTGTCCWLYHCDEACRANAIDLSKDGSVSSGSRFPDGVINVVPGFGPTAGGAIVKHPGIDKVAFTGEHRTAQIIMREASDSLKRITFELGGKSPNVIWPTRIWIKPLQGPTLDSSSIKDSAVVRGVESSSRRRCMPSLSSD